MMDHKKSVLPFTKMQGLGNDFVVVDELFDPRPKALNPVLAQAICDRRFGVGADQILWLKKPHQSDLDARMEILNADGSTAEMCGNGIRAVAVYLRNHGSTTKLNYSIETLAGVMQVSFHGDQVEVDMGRPELGGGFTSEGESLSIEGQVFRFFEVSMGNPHAVLFTHSVEEVELEKWGPRIETHPRFPKKTNVEFVQVIDSNTIQVRVWERGAGVTLACGTGACASAVASLKLGNVQNPVLVKLPGGDLKISWSGASVKMTGPAKEVYSGSYLIG